MTEKRTGEIKGTRTFFGSIEPLKVGRFSRPTSLSECRFQSQAESRLLLPNRGTERLAAVDAAAQGFDFFLGLRAVHAGGPVARQWRRAIGQNPADRVDYRPGFDSAAVEQASPTPVFRASAQPGPQGIAFRVPQDGEVMVVFLNGKRLESALVKMAATGRVAVGVPALGMRVREPAEKFGEFAVCFGPKNEMPVVRHQAIP